MCQSKPMSELWDPGSLKKAQLLPHCPGDSESFATNVQHSLPHKQIELGALPVWDEVWGIQEEL